MKKGNIKEMKIQIHNLTSIVIFIHLIEYLIGNINANKIEISFAKFLILQNVTSSFHLKIPKKRITTEIILRTFEIGKERI